MAILNIQLKSDYICVLAISRDLYLDESCNRLYDGFLSFWGFPEFT